MSASRQYNHVPPFPSGDGGLVAAPAVGTVDDGAPLRHHRTQRIINPFWTPLDATAIADLLHKSRWWVGAIVKHRDTPFSGRYCTLHKVKTWLDAHPEFRADDHYAARRSERACQKAFEARLGQIAKSAQAAASSPATGS